MDVTFVTYTCDNFRVDAKAGQNCTQIKTTWPSGFCKW